MGQPRGTKVIKNLANLKSRDLKYSVSVEEMQDLMKKIKDFYKKFPSEITLFDMAKWVLQRLKLDKDYYVNIEGEKGVGKSNFLVLILLVMSRYAGVWYDKVEKKYYHVRPRIKPLDPKRFEQISCSFNFVKNLSFLDETETLKDKFNSLDRYMGFGIDEGSKNLHKQKWQDNLQFQLVQMSDTERWQNKFFAICFPNFMELNTNFRNDRIQMRIYLYERNKRKGYSKAILSIKDPSRWTSDPWHLKENQQIFEHTLKKVPMVRRTPHYIEKAEKRLVGYAGQMMIPNLSKLAPRLWKIYYGLKVENAKKNSKESKITKESINIQKHKYSIKKLVVFIKYKFPKLNYGEIAKVANMSASQLSSLMNQTSDVEDRILKEKKIKEEARKVIRGE